MFATIYSKHLESFSGEKKNTSTFLQVSFYVDVSTQESN